VYSGGERSSCSGSSLDISSLYRQHSLHIIQDLSELRTGHSFEHANLLYCGWSIDLAK
jgi:hypothetical protein